MEEVKSTTTAVITDFAASSISKYEGLVDIPLNQKIIDSLIKLFNYLDIYGPKMPLVYTIVTAFRFFQLIGGSFMAANHNVFKPGTLTYDVMGVITVFFHLLPVEYRRGNGFLIQIIFDLFLILMAFYLIVTAFRYKSTSKVSYLSTLILTIFMAIGPFLFVPIVAQYAAQTTSGLIRGVTVPDAQRISSIILTCIAILLWMWIIIAAYTKSLVFRPCSFASVQGTPQTKLYITTTVVTFASALTTNLPQYYSAGCMVVSFLLYIYSATTVFRCGTFIKTVHQALILSGSIIGMVLCGANLYPILTRSSWGPEFFVGFAALFIITYISCYFYIRARQRKELKILDEINETDDMKVISVGKFKQMVVTGFTYSHPICLSYRFFKLAIEEWRDELDVYNIYAMFAAIYPDQTAQLTFICQYVSGMKTDNKTVQSSILSSATNILKSRETNYTQDLKRKIAKLNKYFNKTKIKLRNVWDLILQGNIIETNQAIKRTKTSVEECDVEMAFLLMQYPNNRFVARQNIIYLNDIKCDPIQTKVAIENLHKLQRGISVVPDTVQNLGMEAFPNLPEFCAASTDASINDGQAIESESLVGEDMYSEDSLDFEAIGTITKQIERHDVPAINYIIWSTIAYFLIIIVLPLIAGIVYFPLFSHELQEPVTIIEGIARTRTTLSVLTGYIGRFIFRMLDDPYNPGHPIQESLEVMPGFNFEAFGGNSKSRSILRYCATEISKTNGDMSKLRAFKPGNKRMERVRRMLFSNSINFTFYINRTNSKKYLSSVSDISYMLANHIGKLCDLPVINAEVVKGSDSMTARNNNNGSLTSMGVALEVMAFYLEDLNQNFRITFLSILGALCGLSFFGYIAIYTIQAKKLRHNRNEILFVLTTLPKTVISNVSASFSKLKKGDSQISESELEGNRQEDSIIKLFASISDGSAHASIESVIALLISLIVVLSCLSYFIVISYFISSSKAVVAKSIHINHLFGCAAYLYGVLSTVFKIALAFYHPMFKDTLVNFDNEVNNIRTRIPTITEYFQRMRLGNPDQDQRPYDGMERAVKYASSVIFCKDKLAPPTRVFDSIHCFSATQQLFITTAILKKYLALMTDKDPIYPNPAERTMARLWQIGPIELYETFFYRAGKEIVPTIFDSIEAQYIKVIRAAVLFILATGILSLLIVYCAKRENEFLHYCLKLFLRCPPMAILSNQRVMNLMSGNYNIKFDESFEKHSQFSEQIVDKLDGVVIVADEETRKISSVNSAFVKMFDIEKEEAEKLNVSDFLVESRFKCNESLEKVYSTTIDVQYTKSDGDLVYLEFSSVLVANRRIFFGTNQTQNVMHEKLIAHEKEKSDRMLASILPASLVPRVQAGEKNISFSVQSVSVLFLDIVSFTPWCGSHDAQYVMRMLNIMFKEFDAITNAHKTMTKIKCIGDCYMAAGGIFDEVNQPAVHSREVVDFGCMVIKKLREIDEKENENLQIRVGVNTGGPIVAGVIGTEKPTFEILGPAINIAHEMEHHGVAMKVHISRPVYELIYGQQFDIKERGEIDVKGGKMFTYLVEP